ncbi:Rv1733c family protein [Kitasatospora sp. NPDC054795]
MASTHRPARPDGPPAPRCGHLRRALGRERNPLGRALDRARSRAVVLTVLGIALAALLSTGAAVTHLADGRRQAKATAARLHHVEASVQGSVRKAETTVAGGKAVYRADAAWTYPGNQRNTGSIDVPRTTGPGATVGIWVDRDGHPAAAPPSTAGLVFDAVFPGLFLFGLLSVLAAAGLCARLTAIDRRADLAWTRSWARLEPAWSGRTRRGNHHG